MALGTALYKLNFQANTDVLKTTRREMSAIRQVAENSASPFDKYEESVRQLDVVYKKANSEGSKLTMSTKEYKDALNALDKELMDATGTTKYLADEQAKLNEEEKENTAMVLRNETALEKLNREKAYARSLAKQDIIDKETERREITRLTLEYEKLNVVTKKSALGMFASRAVSRFAAVTAASAMALVSAVAFRKVASSYSEFAQAMAHSTAIIDETPAQFKRMAQAAIDTSFQVEASATQVAEGFFFLASAGMDAEESLKSLPIVAAFAQAGSFDLATATDLLTDAQVALGLNVGSTSDKIHNLALLSDMLTKANTGANASIEQFSAALTNKAAASMKLMNMEVSEGIAVLQAFADQGLKGEEGGTAFAIVTRDLATQAIKNAEAWKRNGLAVFDADNQYRHIYDIIGDLEDRMVGLSDLAKKQLLIDLGIPQKSTIFTQMLLGMSEKMRENAERTKGAWGETNKVAEDGMSKITRATNVAKAGFGEFAIIVGDAFMGGTGDLESFEDYFRLFNRRVKESAPLIEEFGSHVVSIGSLLGTWAGGLTYVVRTATRLNDILKHQLGVTLTDVAKNAGLLAVMKYGVDSYINAYNPELVGLTAEAQERLNKANSEFIGGAKGEIDRENEARMEAALANELLIESIGEANAKLQEEIDLWGLVGNERLRAQFVAKGASIEELADLDKSIAKIKELAAADAIVADMEKEFAKAKADAERDAEKKEKEKERAAKKITDTVAAYTRALNDQIATHGMSADAAKRYKLEQDGVSAEDIKAIKILQEKARALDDVGDAAKRSYAGLEAGSRAADEAIIRARAAGFGAAGKKAAADLRESLVGRVGTGGFGGVSRPDVSLPPRTVPEPYDSLEEGKKWMEKWLKEIAYNTGQETVREEVTL